MSASQHRATESKHLPGMKAESGSVVGTDKVKTPPVLKLAVLEIKPQGKKHSDSKAAAVSETRGT